MPGEYVFMAYKLRATGAEGRTDSRKQVGMPAIEIPFHTDYNIFQDVLHITPPAAMNIGYHLFSRVKDNNPLAVRLFYHECNTGHIRYHGIGRGNPTV